MASNDEIARRIEKKIEKPMILLSLLIIPVLLVELGIVTNNQRYISFATLIDDIIWFIFLLEYLLLVSLSSNKIEYTKKNWFNVLIILITPPIIFPSSFASLRTLRALRLLRFLRIMIPLKRGIKPIYDIYTKNSFHHIAFITFSFIVISGAIFGWVENQSVVDGIWWAIATVTTVGYGDLYPKTVPGRLFASLLMLVGIACVSILTANIASYFVSKDTKEESKSKDIVSENELILKKLDELSRKIEELDEKVSHMKRN
ncbi:MAG: potassium channel family protein [Methanolobus sp.]|uniref:potassium channel family protein n=1 Tax=Methanolobus sp. TaxID=1874737 RepID=UPI0027317E13|nr:potassium channel family protein [Methanolobus sp.]MDP2218334.1 potassium channel family protein [Methanolobus sp.]